MESGIACIDCSPYENLSEARQRVETMYSDSLLKSIPWSSLQFFSNLADLKAFDNPLLLSTQVSDVTASASDPIIVLVPTKVAGSKRSITDWWEIHHPRKGRWIKLNAILSDSRKRRKSQNDSTQYSGITWGMIREVIPFQPYIQDQFDISEALLDELQANLSVLSFSTPMLSLSANEAQRLRYIDLIILSVCKELKGVSLYYEQSIAGDLVEADGRYDIMLKRNDRAICVVEAKRDAFEEGLAQDLVCCEVEAEINRWSKVYGIVTNVMVWRFVCSTDDVVQYEAKALSLDGTGTPTRESLRIIIGKIQGMLLTEEEIRDRTILPIN